jgi:hypothetical protein
VTGRRKLDPDGEFRLQQALFIIGDDRTRIDEVVNMVLDGLDGMRPITGAERIYKHHLLRWKLYGLLTHKACFEREERERRISEYGESTEELRKLEEALKTRRH